MSDQVTRQLLREAEFIETYTQYYRRQLEAATRALDNSNATGQQCIDLCMEALRMIGDSKNAMMAAIRPAVKV